MSSQMTLKRLVQQLHIKCAQDETAHHGTPGREVEHMNKHLYVFPQTIMSGFFKFCIPLACD
jgi:hypothetical protein